MRTRTDRSKNRTATLVGVVGILIVIFAPPLRAAPPKTKERPTSLVPPTAATSTATKDQVSPTAPATEVELPALDIIKGLRTGQLSATGEGTGDGRMTVTLTNRTNHKLRVVLPPGLIAAGASGQFGGMGGMGGGMGGMGGGMGGMGGGMGGMGGGMGGMGGGMGGMGGGMGGRGGMMGGRGGMGMRGGGTMPASMGMMMLGRLIMTLVGDRDSWDQRSLMAGMMMGMGGRGMMGGGMGMMGGGMGMMGGGMGGGFRSVPPTSLPETTLQPHQVRHLPTSVISMNGPDANARPVVPAKGEALRIGAIEQWTDDSRTRAALKGLAELKAPQTIAQMVLWNVTSGADWDDVGRLSQGWGNAQELALAHQFVLGMDKQKDKANDKDKGRSSPVDPGPLYWEIKTEGDRARGLADGLRALWAKYPVIGLTAREGVPEKSNGPALACRLVVSEAGVEIKLAASHPSGSEWVSFGEFRIKPSELKPIPTEATKESPALTADQKREREAAQLGDAVAGVMVGRLVRMHLSHGPRVKGKESYKMKIVNESPMILNGVALAGSQPQDDQLPSVLAGFCLPPLKSMTVPASAEMVGRLHLKEGVRVLAADLSGL